MNLEDHFPRASKSFLDANRVILEGMGHPERYPDNQNAVQSIVERKKGKHETNHQRKIQDSEQCEQKAALGSGSEGEASCPRRPLVGFTLFRVKLLDWEAKYSSVKDLLDGLRYAGLIRGDKEGEIRLDVRQEKVRTRKEETTEIEVEIPIFISTKIGLDKPNR